MGCCNYAQARRLVSDGGHFSGDRPRGGGRVRGGHDGAGHDQMTGPGLQRLGEQLTAEVRELLDPAMRARLDGAQANVTLLGDRLRDLHEAGDGLRLP